MTVRINKPALNLREELTKAQGVVRYEQRQFWMDGLVENGTFDNDLSGWTANAESSVISGELNFLKTTASWGAVLSDYFPTVKGKKYIYMYDVTSHSGNGIRVVAQNGSGANIYVPISHGVGSFSFTFTATTSSSRLSLGTTNSSTVDATIDNIQAFEVDENDNVIHSVPLGFKPVHVYEDGLLQREGANHDYTVIDTGFGYQVKPAVAPSATTETCIIAEREL